MRIKLWGTRGSLPAPGPGTARYGGNTSCVEVTGPEGSVVVLDAGTGIRELGAALSSAVRRVDVLLSHLHMDHIQGLGFFAPLFDPGRDVHIWGPASTTLDLRARLMRYLSSPLFPVPLRDLPCRLQLHEVADSEFRIGEFEITSALICHPGPTVGYRLKTADGVMAYLSDHEPALGDRSLRLPADWTSGQLLARETDLLIHDAQYTDAEYASRVGWGHSSLSQAFRFADRAETRHFVPFHHDPTHDDATLDRLFGEAIAHAGPRFRVTAAKEGEILEVRRRPGQPSSSPA